MTFWIEVHCDVPDDLKAKGGPNSTGGAFFDSDRCYSDQGNHPAIMVATLAGSTRHVTETAIDRGFKKTLHGWTCPACYKLIKMRKAEIFDV